MRYTIVGMGFILLVVLVARMTTEVPAPGAKTSAEWCVRYHADGEWRTVAADEKPDVGWGGNEWRVYSTLHGHESRRAFDGDYEMWRGPCEAPAQPTDSTP